MMPARFASRCLILAVHAALALSSAGAGEVPGVVVDHIPATTRQYVGSPGLAILPDGAYIASHDIFGPGSTRDRTLVFASEDRGATWTRRAEILGQWWSTLFVHRGALYLMGTSREYGHAVIRRSNDAGRTWTTPDRPGNGLLLADGRYHCAPVPVVVHAGRIWRGMEDAMGPGGWGHHFRAFMMSAPEDADLLDAASWTCTNRIGRDPSWLGGRFGGWLEGNAVVTPEGTLIDLLRVDDRPGGDVAARIEISADGTSATFDPATGFVPFPGGSKKFTVRHDPISGYYWSLSNIVPDRYRAPGRNSASIRNTLALIRSKDLKSWETRAVLLQNDDVARHGFQYVEWLIEGDDLVALVRTAHDDGVGGAHNAHDANYLTFHRFERFRDLAKDAEGTAP